MAIDKTNKGREVPAEGGEEMLAAPPRTFTDKAPLALHSNWAIIERDPCWNCNTLPRIYVLRELSPHVARRELCFTVNCELSCFPPGCALLLTRCKDGNS